MGVRVGVFGGVGVLVGVDVTVGVRVGVGVDVGVRVAVRVGVAVRVCDGDEVEVRVSVQVGVGVRDGVDVGGNVGTPSHRPVCVLQGLPGRNRTELSHAASDATTAQLTTGNCDWQQPGCGVAVGVGPHPQQAGPSSVGQAALKHVPPLHESPTLRPMHCASL